MSYIYNPGEPAGVPYQPFPVIDNPLLNVRVDLNTRGICGNCRHCPRVWKLQIPLEGDGYFTGTYYLRRTKYAYQGAESQFEFQQCAWSSAWDYPGCPINGANVFNGQDGRGWVLTFGTEGGENWYLRTPVYEDGGFNAFQSLFQYPAVLNNYRCLESNVFTFREALLEFPYPISAEQLTLTPYYA